MCKSLLSRKIMHPIPTKPQHAIFSWPAKSLRTSLTKGSQLLDRSSGMSFLSQATGSLLTTPLREAMATSASPSFTFLLLGMKLSTSPFSSSSMIWHM